MGLRDQIESDLANLTSTSDLGSAFSYRETSESDAVTGTGVIDFTERESVDLEGRDRDMDLTMTFSRTAIETAGQNVIQGGLFTIDDVEYRVESVLAKRPGGLTRVMATRVENVQRRAMRRRSG